MKRRRGRCLRLAGLLWRNYPLFRLAGVPVQINGTFAIFPFGFLVIGHWVSFGISGALTAGVVLAMALGNVLVHEFAHVLTAARFGVATDRVVISPFGCVALMEAALAEPAEIFVAIAGPAASLLLALLGWAALALTGTSPEFVGFDRRLWVAIFTWSNFAIGVFNLLPCFPMDGGRVLRSTLAIMIGLLWPRHAGRALLIATRIAVRWFAWPISVGIIAATFGFTHLWHHVILFTLIPLAGEAELFCLKTSPQFGGRVAELHLIPATSHSSTKEQAGLCGRHPRGVLRIEEVA